MVLDEEDGQVVVRADLLDHDRQFVDFAVGKSGCRLIEHEQFGVPDQATGEFDALECAVGQACALLECNVCKSEVSQDRECL